MAGDQRHHEHRLLARRMRTHRENPFPLLAQLLQVSRQALITDDFRHRSFLQAAIGVDDPLLVVGEEEQRRPEHRHEHRRQQTEGTAGMNPVRVFAQTRHGGR